MVGFKNAVKGTGINNWWSDENQRIAFSRGEKGFIVFTNGGHINQLMQTRLPAGTYCDVISGSLIENDCTGKNVTVARSGMGFISLNDDEFDGVLAIHIQAKLDL